MVPSQRCYHLIRINCFYIFAPTFRPLERLTEGYQVWVLLRNIDSDSSALLAAPSHVIWYRLRYLNGWKLQERRACMLVPVFAAMLALASLMYLDRAHLLSLCGLPIRITGENDYSHFASMPPGHKNITWLFWSKKKSTAMIRASVQCTCQIPYGHLEPKFYTRNKNFNHSAEIIF